MLKEKVLIFAEVSSTQVTPVFFELLAKARSLTEGEVACVALGHNIGPRIEQLKASGVDTVYALDHQRLEIYNPEYFSAALVAVCKMYQPGILFFGATSIGEELAPTLGIKLNTGVAAHCMDVHLTEDGRLAQLVPAFGGKVVGEIFTPNTLPKIISIKPGVLPFTGMQPKECEVKFIDTSVLEFPSAITPSGVVCNIPGGKEIDKADFVACTGYGIPSSTTWEKVQRLTEKLDGAAGYTRPVIDFGFVNGETNMVGTSGKSIRPKLYLGLGISGSTHHVCGMKDSGVIIAVNTDPNAEIFNVCDYKIIGDGEQILDAILEELA